MRTHLFMATMTMAALLGGCSEGAPGDPEPRDEPLHASAKALAGGAPGETGAAPPQAGTWNGTHLTLHAQGIEAGTVRSVRFASSQDQDCRFSYHTEGDITEPWAIGWSVGISPDQFSFGHEMIHGQPVDGAVAGSSIGGSTPARHVVGTSSATYDLDAGEEMIHYVVADYPAGGAGSMELAITCPGGMVGLETGWSNRAYLLSDVSMEGTWASVHVEGVARWATQPLASWSADLPANETLFLSTAPVVGRAELAYGPDRFRCGPVADRAAVEGHGFCSHRFPGGETDVTVSQATIGRFGQTRTNDAWMALVAQMETHRWPSDP